ncbi:hypothetical protein K523DRAFT_378781 [Schizophyllum commune Tattone D]|nr:hypothetical protein K523DRAFT_378781 [Schizophyllum commune Tattone D]
MDERQRAPSAPVITASRTTSRGQDGHTTTLIPCRPPRSIVVQPSPSPPLLRHNYDTNDGPQKSEYSRGMGIPSTRETAATQNALARPVPTLTRHVSTLDAPPHTTDRDFPRNRTPSRAGRNARPEIAVPAFAIEVGHRNGREYAASVLPPPLHIDAMREGQDGSTPHAAYANESRMTTTSECDVAHATRVATSSSTPARIHSALAPSRSVPPESPLAPPTLPRYSLPYVCANTTHLRTTSDACEKDTTPLDTVKSRKEYTRADSSRLAGALAQGRGEGPSRAHRVKPRANSTCLNTIAAALPYPRHSSLTPPPQLSIQPLPSRPMPSMHPAPTSCPRSIPLGDSTRTAPLSTDTRTQNGYAGANTICLARAPAAAHSAYSAAHRVGYSNSRGSEVRSLHLPMLAAASVLGQEEIPSGARGPQVVSLGMSAPTAPVREPTSPQGVFLHATNDLPPPPLPVPPPPPQGPALLPPPPPPGWPFPMSVEELGWVLAAVVMARRMDQEDEQCRRDEESEDGDSFIFEQDEMHTYEADPSHNFSSNSNDEHASDADTTSFVESTPWSLRHDSPISCSFDFDTIITRDWQEHEYPGNTNNSASPVSPPVAFLDIEPSDGDSQDWEEPSAPWDESGRDFADNDESE